MVWAGFQNTAARGSVARNPAPRATNLMSPGASGSDALVLLSARTIQPGGACAVRRMIASDPISSKNTIRFIKRLMTEIVRLGRSDRPPDDRHYPRSARSGSVRVARHAGRKQAVNDAMAMTTNADPNASGSRGLTL